MDKGNSHKNVVDFFASKFVNDSYVGSLTDFVFKNLKIISLQISGAQMIEVSENAFRGKTRRNLTCVVTGATRGTR